MLRRATPRPIPGPRIRLLEAEVLACGRDGLLRAAFHFPQLLPCNGHGNTLARSRARRKCRRSSGSVPIAQGVHEELASPVLRAALGHEARRYGASQVLNDRLRKVLDCVVVEPGARGTTTCSPLAPGVLSQHSSPSGSSIEHLQVRPCVRRSSGQDGCTTQRGTAPLTAPERWHMQACAALACPRRKNLQSCRQISWKW